MRNFFSQSLASLFLFCTATAQADSLSGPIEIGPDKDTNIDVQFINRMVFAGCSANGVHAIAGYFLPYSLSFDAQGMDEEQTQTFVDAVGLALREELDAALIDPLEEHMQRFAQTRVENSFNAAMQLREGFISDRNVFDTFNLEASRTVGAMLPEGTQLRPVPGERVVLQVSPEPSPRCGPQSRL